MIKLFQVKKRYGSATALDNISLHIQPGEFVFITGPSGAGKTTLLRIIFREEVPTDGQVIVDGQHVARLSKRIVPYHRRSIGVVLRYCRNVGHRPP
ncbi:MAG TPA: ATP-binding cassette domain-containing protein, partial [bacterium]|nr:ATP-binding cassette domain-containing protein [bacterium]